MSMTTPTKEAIRLYRDILRTVKLFRFTTDGAKRWDEKLAQSARNEFEAHRYEKDPQTIAQLLVQGRDSLQQIHLKIAEKQTELTKKK